MTYFRITKHGKSYGISYRRDTDKFPFITELYGAGYRMSSRVQEWKTEEGARKSVLEKHPDWQEETLEQYRARLAEHRAGKK